MMSLQFFHSPSVKDIALETSPRQSGSAAEEAAVLMGTVHFCALSLVSSLLIPKFPALLREPCFTPGEAVLTLGR